MIIKLQKRAVRIISLAPYKAHTSDLFNNLNILVMSKIYVYHVLVLMFKFNKNMLPSVTNDLFTISVNVYNTRQSNKLYVPVGKTSAIYKTIRFKGVNLWNSFSTTLDVTCSIQTFKRNLRIHLLNNNLL